MPDNQLSTLRSQIDEINLKILALLNQRAGLASEIGKLQQQLGTSFYDPQREGEMLQSLELANQGPFSNETVKALFKEIFKASMALEEKEAKAKMLVQRKRADERTIVELPNGVKIGDGSFAVISGPCAVESFEQMDQTAAEMAKRGVKILRGMAFKPRSSPYDFQGLGEEGLKIARQVANKYDMAITSEIMDASQIPMMMDYVDIFWVGARNMQNSFLLKAVGKINKPIILKRHFAATIQEMLYAAEYIVSSGNPNVIFMERGIRTFETWTRNTLDISAVPLVKLESHLPIILDASHSGGRRDLVIPLAKIIRSSGADGLMFETHPNPPVAMSDAKQQLNLPEFHKLMDEIGM